MKKVRVEITFLIPLVSFVRTLSLCVKCSHIYLAPKSVLK